MKGGSVLELDRSEELCTNKRWALKGDILASITLFLIVIVLGTGLLDRGHEWGDDFAAYMLQAQAIANGTMEEQNHINRIIHASVISFGEEPTPDTLTYVWGYPLALSAVYKLIGYHPQDGGIPIVYKIPNLVAYGIFVVLLYLFYRRRFSLGTSLFLAALFALHRDMLLHTNVVMSDIFCLMLSVAALLLIEIFLDTECCTRKALIGILLGAVLWYNYEVRLNGVTIIYVVLMAHVLTLIRKRLKKEEWLIQLVPYAVLIGLMSISLHVFPAATGNSSHIASGPNSQILFNICYYDGEISGWIRRMLPEFVPMREYAHYLVYILIVIGVLRAGILKNLHLTILMAGTIVVVLLLPYVQPLRYLFNVLPLMILFAAYGLQSFGCFVKNIGKSRSAKLAGYALMVLITAGMLLDTTQQIALHVERGGTEYRYEAYSEDALDIYAYIRSHTTEDARIGCVKPRALTLNTGRIGFMPGINGNRYKDMHYLLAFKDQGLYDSVTESIWPELWNELTEVYHNDSFILYEMSEAYRSQNE